MFQNKKNLRFNQILLLILSHLFIVNEALLGDSNVTDAIKTQTKS